MQLTHQFQEGDVVVVHYMDNHLYVATVISHPELSCGGGHARSRRKIAQQEMRLGNIAVHFHESNGDWDVMMADRVRLQTQGLDALAEASMMQHCIH